MSNICKIIVIVVAIIIAGCSNSPNKSIEDYVPKTEIFNFTGTIKEITRNTALVNAKIEDGVVDVLVDLSVNNQETFAVGDKIKVGYDGIIKESNPAQINTLSVELIE